jgi:tRNA/tmRNA/rRNA uracil-C5-methylase (TrmA/RlmC/RlmD family)
MGLDAKVIDAFLKNRVGRLIYVSCNPSTLAKNLKQLLKGYDIEYIQPIDMFPHTASVESITILKAR